MSRLATTTKLGALAAALFAFGGGIFIQREGPARPTSDVRALAAGLVGAPHLRAAYASWAADHERRGGDRSVELVLGRSDPHRLDQAAALGSLRLDLVSGVVEASIPRLPAEPRGYTLWLVDNASNPRNGSNPDAGDRFLEVGPLLAKAGTPGQNGVSESQTELAFRLRAELGPEAFASFQVDSAVVVVAGEAPTSPAVMAGAPDLFQRVYSATRTPELFEASDYAALLGDQELSIGFGARPALAARKPNPERTIVDLDVLLDRLIARGADLFINETFDGNGRTCSTCHTLKNNLTLDPGFIATLSDQDPLFITEQIPDLASDGTKPGALDVPEILRRAALVGIPGPDTVANPAINRSVTHLRGLNNTVAPPAPVIAPFGPDNPAPFPLPDTPMPNTVMGMTIDNATVPPFERAGFGGDLAFVPQRGRFGRARDAVPGATMLLLTRSLNRVPGVDFRVPTDLETDAVAAFFFSLGRSEDLSLPIPLSDPIARRGQAVFMNDGGALNGNEPGNAQVIPVADEFGNPIPAGKCNICHFNAGALTNPKVFGSVEPAFARMLGIPRDQFPSLGLRNMNFETGVERLPSQPANIVAADKKGRDAGFGLVPHAPGGSVAASGCSNGRGGFGTFIMVPFPGANPPDVVGDCIEEFNTQPLVEAADTPPFFHNNAVSTIEMAVEFYNTDAFNQSASARLLGAVTGTNGIRLEATEVQAIASFLRAINALDNLREARENLRAALVVRLQPDLMDQLVQNAMMHIGDAIRVLSGAGVNTTAVDQLRDAQAALQRARGDSGSSGSLLGRLRIFRRARAGIETARALRGVEAAQQGISPSR